VTLITIPHGQNHDGDWVEVGVNGDVRRLEIGTEIDIADAYIEALTHAGVSYTLSENLTPPEGFAFVVDGDANYVVDGDGAYVVTEI
jgi:hypothetical protein